MPWPLTQWSWRNLLEGQKLSARDGHQSIHQIREWGGAVTATQGRVLQPGREAGSSGNSHCFIAWGNASLPVCAKKQALWQRHVCMQLHVTSNFTAKEIFKMLNSIQLNDLQAKLMPAISSEMQKTMGSLAGWGTDRCRMRQKQVQWNADLGDGVCGKRLHHLKFVPNNYYGKGIFEIRWC